MDYIEFIKKSKRSDSVLNNKLHFLSSKLSNITAFILYKFGFSANMATLLFGIVGIVSGISFYFEYYLIGYILFRIHIIIDMADGTIARANKQFSDYADGFDKVNHIIVNVSIILALAKSSSYETIMLLLPIFLVYYLFTKLFKKYPKGVHTSSNSLIKVIIKNLFSFEGYIIAMCLNLSFSMGQQDLINYFYTVLFLILIIMKSKYMVSNNEK